MKKMSVNKYLLALAGSLVLAVLFPGLAYRLFSLGLSIVLFSGLVWVIFKMWACCVAKIDARVVAMVCLLLFLALGLTSAVGEYSFVPFAVVSVVVLHVRAFSLFRSLFRRLPSSESVGHVLLCSLAQAVAWFLLRHLFQLAAYVGYGVSSVADGHDWPSRWNDSGIVLVPSGLFCAVYVARARWFAFANEPAPRVAVIRSWLGGAAAWAAGHNLIVALPFVLSSGAQMVLRDMASSMPTFLPSAVNVNAQSDLLVGATIFAVNSCIGLSGLIRKHGSRLARELMAIALLILPVWSVPETVRAYDDFANSIYLTMDAATLLNRLHGGRYAEMVAYSASSESGMQAGTIEENDYPRYFSHFYKPTDSSALFPCPSPIVECMDARSWLLHQNYYENGLAYYRQGNKELAYRHLGHALHLVTQDMFSPAHVFNDWLVEYLEAVPDWKQSAERWAKDTPSVTVDHRRWGRMIRLFPTGPDMISQALSACATVTYKAVRIEGTLTELPESPATGELAEMFPKGHFQALSVGYVLDPVLNIPVLVWSIPDVGNCWSLTGAQGFPVFDDWWLVDNFEGETSNSYYYIENSYHAYPRSYDGVLLEGNLSFDSSSKRSLAELWTLGLEVSGHTLGERLLAQSQEASAGVLFQFAKAVDDLDPTFTLVDGNGKAVEEGGAITTDEVTVHAVDQVNDDFPVPSGFYRIVLRNLGTGVDTIREFNGTPEADATYSGLVPGDYVAIVSDGLGRRLCRTPRLRAATPRARDC